MIQQPEGNFMATIISYGPDDYSILANRLQGYM